MLRSVHYRSLKQFAQASLLYVYENRQVLDKSYPEHLFYHIFMYCIYQ